MSTIKVNSFQDTSGNSLHPVKVWAVWEGYGTVSLLGSANVSSITDQGTGLYLCTFSITMSSARGYSSVAAAGFADNAGSNGFRDSSCPRATKTSSTCDVSTATGGGSGSDAGNVSFEATE